MAGPVADANGVAIRSRVNDASGRDGAAGAADGLDDDRWPSARPIGSARIRPSVSVGPPGGNPISMVIGCDG